MMPAAARLDCLHGNGPAALARQEAIAQRIARAWQCDVSTTPTGPAPVDAVITCGGELIGLAEIKARDLTLAALRRMQPPGYLVTFDKLRRGRALAHVLSVPYHLIVGLYPEQRIVWWNVSTATGAWRARFTVERTPTQATCNGGTARRLNAYLALDDMRTLDGVRSCGHGESADAV